MSKRIVKNDMNDKPVSGLLDSLRQLIITGRQRALRAVDVVQVQTCWEMGRHIVEFEQDGAGRAEYGARLLPRLAKELTADFGKGFDTSNLRYMRLFYKAFPIRDALRHELSWTHYRLLLRVENEKARDWYVNEAATQNWSTRALERQIGTLYYERLLVSQDRKAVIEHNDSQALQRGVEFKAAYNECMTAFTSDADRLSALIQNFTDVAVDPDDDTVQPIDTRTANQDRERLIRELDPHIPHSLIEDFRYKRPLGFILEGEPYVPRNTWSQVYTSVCKHLAKKSPNMFQGLPENPDFISTHGNRSFSRSEQQLREGKDVGMGIYAEFNLNANQLRDAIKDLLTYFKVPHDHFTAYLREDRDSQG